ncbi:hypothetical protein PsYK624_024850 [Phanerochaete sordida]|uniref:Uncharacterized protein n=1 Tax=Phanerochaete sordida TaxID=48140 RepID=A0A9P3G1W8_9APHY|nr:hypothetical protein PsYK624_024850 [Phanerochaete sordida]
MPGKVRPGGFAGSIKGLVPRRAPEPRERALFEARVLRWEKLFMKGGRATSVDGLVIGQGCSRERCACCGGGLTFLFAWSALGV